jgi:hypothetical protein
MGRFPPARLYPVMSDSVPIRWISRYITKVADKYGMSFLDVAVEVGLPSEKEKIQIIEVRAAPNICAQF